MSSEPPSHKVRAGFTLSKILVVESLRPSELQTGKILVGWLQSLVADYAPSIGVERVPLEGAAEFSNLLRTLVETAQSIGEWPVLHIECHGSEQQGLQFSDRSTLSWDALGELIVELNTATGFNLLVVVSACFGAHLLSQFSPVKPSPAWCMIAPTDTVDPAELMQGFRLFYGTLLQTNDAGRATSDLLKVPLTAGSWFAKLAEDWYEEVILQFIERECTHVAFDRRAKKMYRKGGRTMSIAAVRRELVSLTNDGLAGKYFDLFFCVERVPENTARFAQARDRVTAHVVRLRSTGKYAL